MNETVFRNGRIVLPERVDGEVVVHDGMIAEVGEGSRQRHRSRGRLADPRPNELHTDHPSTYSPRPKVRHRSRQPGA
jgi:alpha-D-ribose 1-methylphosphonate 5-triphosphate diphosphatase PhnM